ncbi:MAG: PAS domain-containing protein [Novosphingobium sp.]
MDSLRGNFGDRGGLGDDAVDAYGDSLGEDAGTRDTPPASIGQDERRMQVRAYNHWAGLLDNRNFPSIEDLDPEALPDFGPFSVLLDFTNGIDNPSIQYLGDQLAEECGATGEDIETLSDVPSRSLLSRITDHYMQILANQAPIGFEAEFVNQRERTILYRGILLPFSSDDDTIDFIYGVINWKEIADQHTTDELMLEIDQALEAVPVHQEDSAMTEWADGPVENGAEVLDLGVGDELAGDPAAAAEWPEPAFGEDAALPAIEPLELAAYADPVSENDYAAPIDLGDFAEVADEPAPALEAAPLPQEDVAGYGLADWLASAREFAEAAQGSEDRTRNALYAAIGRAYDFSLAATEAPDEFAELVADSGLTTQDRAPLTPLVKLVFGADYDKTRLTEFAAALGHAHRIGLGRGALADYLGAAPGGLKGVVTAERRLRREESGRPVDHETPRETLARKLRKLPARAFEDIAVEGSEFALLLIRRLPTGELVLLGEVPEDVPLLEKAGKKLLG